MVTIQKIDNETCSQFIKRIKGILETHNLDSVSAEFNGWTLKITPAMTSEYCEKYFLQPHPEPA